MCPRTSVNERVGRPYLAFGRPTTFAGRNEGLVRDQRPVQGLVGHGLPSSGQSSQGQVPAGHASAAQETEGHEPPWQRPLVQQEGCFRHSEGQLASEQSVVGQFAEVPLAEGHVAAGHSPEGQDPSVQWFFEQRDPAQASAAPLCSAGLLSSQPSSSVDNWPSKCPNSASPSPVNRKHPAESVRVCGAAHSVDSQ